MLWKYYYQRHWIDVVSPGTELVRLEAEVTPSILLKDQQNPLKNEVDVYVTCIGGSIPCHRSILTSSSLKFREILKHQDPTELAEVQLNYKLSEIAPVIHFFYTGNVTIITSEENNLRKVLRDLSCLFNNITTVRINSGHYDITGNRSHIEKDFGQSFLYCNDSMNNMNPQLHQFQNHWIRYKRLRQGEVFHLAEVKILHPQFLH